jgi:hypothetical protein
LLEIFRAAFPGAVRVFVNRNGDGHGGVRVVAEVGFDETEEAFARREPRWQRPSQH